MGTTMGQLFRVWLGCVGVVRDGSSGAKVVGTFEFVT